MHFINAQFEFGQGLLPFLFDDTPETKGAMGGARGSRSVAGSSSRRIRTRGLPYLKSQRQATELAKKGLFLANTRPFWVEK